MIFAPRSWPSSPGLATTTRILLWIGELAGGIGGIHYAGRPPSGRQPGPSSVRGPSSSAATAAGPAQARPPAGRARLEHAGGSPRRARSVPAGAIAVFADNPSERGERGAGPQRGEHL